MVTTKGTTTRPDTVRGQADWKKGYWPPPNKLVDWTLAPVLVRLAAQAEKLGYTVYALGNEAHREAHGDHTAWSDPGLAGGENAKKRGVVYAIDVMVPAAEQAAFAQAVRAVCQSAVNTRYIDFFNIDGKQYDYAGRLLGPSGDQHFHLSIEEGHENADGSLLLSKWKRPVLSKLRGLLLARPEPTDQFRCTPAHAKVGKGE